MEHLNSSAGLDATVFMPRGAELGIAGTIGIAKQFMLAEVLFLGFGRDTPRARAPSAGGANLGDRTSSRVSAGNT